VIGDACGNRCLKENGQTNNQRFPRCSGFNGVKKGVMSGYGIIGFIHNKFRILISSGTVYSLLYSLEREGLIEGRWNHRKRVYQLRNKDEKTILNANNDIQYLVKNFLKC
jgi:DNA-binding PadR family transcriptional regulator